MGLSTAGINKAATHFATDYPYLTLHSDDPGDDGANLTSADPVAASWVTSAGVNTAASVAFTGVADSGAVKYAGWWSTSDTDTGEFGGSQALTGDQTANAAGAYTITSLTVTDANPS